MTFKEAGFRSFYHNFSLVSLNQVLRERISGIDGHEVAQYALTYGYVDPEEGLKLLILAAAVNDENGFGFADDNTDKLRTVGIEEVAEQECLFMNTKDPGMENHYYNKIRLIAEFEVDADVEKTRAMEFLDDSRDPVLIDNVKVVFRKEGLQEETCIARIVGLGKNYFIARLIEGSRQNFGYRKGDMFTFILEEVSKGKVICIANFREKAAYTASDLEDGRMLKDAVVAFNKNKTEMNLLNVMEILRDSKVWVPCRVVDDADVNEMTKLVPDIISHESLLYMPVFSNPAEMGDYGKELSLISEKITDVVDVYNKCDKKLTGIVLNPFSQPFVLESQFLELLVAMKSNLE